MDLSSAVNATVDRQDRVSAVAEPPLVAEDIGRPDRRSFDEIFQDLVLTITPRAVAPSIDGKTDQLRSRVEDLLTELLLAFPDAAERSLGRIARHSVLWSEPSVGWEARAAGIVIDFGLQRMTREAALAERRPGFVRDLIQCMPTSQDMAGFACEVLVEKPYLEASHEVDLLELARQAVGDLAFLAVPVKRLLLTLWGNVSAGGAAGVSKDLLIYFNDVNAGALREAALQRLLLSDLYRRMVMDHLIASKDEAAMNDAALYAVKNLPFKDSIEVLASLQSTNADVVMIGTYSWMSTTHAHDMRLNYEACLADNVTPRHRESLVATVGNAPMPADKQEGIECAQTAFDMDPSPRVRGVGFLALSNNANSETVMNCFNRAAQDRDFATKYDFDYIVRGIQSYARRTDRDVNFLEGATRFLLTHATNNASARAQLENVRREYLPR